MIHYTASMTGFEVVSQDTDYTLTGYRYFDKVNFTYWYETIGEVWILGNGMKYHDGRIK